jgi:hypothetical protein
VQKAIVIRDLSPDEAFACLPVEQNLTIILFES